VFDKNETPVFSPEKLKHPVVKVTWYEAQEYVAWLNQIQNSEFKIQNFQFRLPSEAEWEKAARGVEGNIYPWGNTFDKNRCNSHESSIGDTTPVGKYSPQGDSAFGCADMAGNVWEWARSLGDFKYPYVPTDGREDEKSDGLRCLRGGSWNDNGGFARASFRYSNLPHGRLVTFGFRVVALPNR
jgi:formylglycine-generating enzyme required for sulfatase activity